LKADFIFSVASKDNYLFKFIESMQHAYYIFIIAPEFSNILFELTKIARDHNKEVLSVNLEGIKLGTSKFKTYEFFKSFGVNTPKTYLIPSNNDLASNFILQKYIDLNRPIVIKPDDGVGAEMIYYFKKKKQLNVFFKNPKKFIDPKRKYILQEYVKGKDSSISLIGLSGDIQQTSALPHILSINFQNIQIKNFKQGSEYYGGYTPVENYEQIKQELMNILRLMDLTPFNSYFGIDFIKCKNSFYLLEINPRLTTSYVGIRNIINKNIAEIIYASKVKSKDINNIKIVNHSLFSKLKLNYVGNKSLSKINEIIISSLLKEVPELITPPISLDNLNHKRNLNFSCFIATKEIDFRSSQKRYREIIQILKKYEFLHLKR
jgi:predicted ATP-grasp superfamily ATP-dependent carboligase